MPREPCSRKTNGTQHACTYTLLIRTLIGTYLVCCLVQGGLRCALLCSRFNDNVHTRTNYCCCCTAIAVYRYSGSARDARSQRSMDWNDRYILGANRRLANAKSSMLQENKRDAACMYVHTFDTYSGRHVLALLLCAGGIALCCAVFAVQRHTYPYMLHCGTVCCCIRTGRA